MSAPSRPIGVTGTALVETAPAGGTFRGYSITDTSGASNLVTLYDNTAASGLVLAQFTLAAAGCRELDINDGTRIEKGIFLSAAGAVVGNVRVG